MGYMEYAQAYLLGFVISAILSVVHVWRNRKLYEEFEFTQNEINAIILITALFSWLDVVCCLLSPFINKKKTKREIIKELRGSLDGIYIIFKKK